MRIIIVLLRIAFALALTVGATVTAAQKLPKEHVIDVPAIGEGLSVHNLFQSNMILQRNKPINIWGWAKAGEKVTVSFAGQSKTATAAKDRAWKVTLDATAANSSPQKLTVQGKNKKLTLENILVGDVWILGGQSNMEFPLDRVENGQLEIISANYDGIRILTVPAQNGPMVKKGFARLHEWSDWSNRHFRKGAWDVCSPKIARELSAIGYVFARRVHMALQVPIGVIDASRGGTTVETWTPTSILEKIDTPEVNALLTEWEQRIADWNPQEDLEKRIKNHHNWVANMKKQGRKADREIPNDLRPGPAMDHNRPSTCYNSMIAPIAGLTVKGAIFHQGFNNALGSGSVGAAMYYQVFGKMITAWRQAFNDPQMPFGIISLCTAGEPQTRDDYLEKMLNDGIYIREAQYRTFLDFYEAGDKNIGFASSFDKRRSWYHPQLKHPVGERISRWALATQYGFEKDIRWKPPMLKEMQVEAGKIILKLDAQVRAVDDAPIAGFAIAGQDRRFQPADVDYLIIGKDQRNQPRLDKRTLVLTSPHVPAPIHFRHAWGRNPLANLQTSDRDDLPFATQRSDDWEMERVPENYVGDAMPPKADLRRIKRFIQRDLRLDDVQRRLQEAKTFIEENEGKYEKERAGAEEEKAREREKKERQ
jgi:sialate O-acetylesterase